MDEKEVLEPAIEDSASEVVDWTVGTPVEAEAEPTPEELAKAKVLREGDVAPEDAKRLMSIQEQTRAKLAKERKVRVQIPKEAGEQIVKINLAQYKIPAGVPVEVPETVARLLRR